MMKMIGPSILRLSIVIATTMVAGCTDPLLSPDGGIPIQAAANGKGAVTSIAVTAADPSWAHQGDVGRRVVITGSGFEAGATVEWRRNGAADARVVVRSVEFVNSRQLVATIDVALDAELAFYDIAVSRGGKQGIGTELFEVTSAIPLGGGNGGRDINDAGAVVGFGFYYLPGTGVVALSPGIIGGANAFEIDAASSTIVGHIFEQNSGKGKSGTTLLYGVIWSWNGTGFGSYTKLPMGTSAQESHAYAITDDGLIIGGSEVPPLGKNETLLSPFPMLWLRNGSSWQRQALPMPAGAARAQVRDVNDSGWAAGNIGQDLADHKGGVIWERTGETSWTPRVLSSTGVVTGLNATNDIATGWIIDSSGNESARYWRRNADGSWMMLIPPGNCKRARGVAITNAILLGGCPEGGRVTGAVLTNFVNLTYLSGLGNRTNAGEAGAISPNGSLAAGNAATRSGALTTVKWELF